MPRKSQHPNTIRVTFTFPHKVSQDKAVNQFMNQLAHLLVGERGQVYLQFEYDPVDNTVFVDVVEEAFQDFMQALTRSPARKFL
jgi:hypothetical protein